MDTMMKMSKAWVLLVAALAVLSCSKKETGPENPPVIDPEAEEMVPYPQTPQRTDAFYARFSTRPKTKVLASDDNHWQWESSDAVLVTDGYEASKYIADSDGVSTLLVGAEVSEGDHYYAFYPYDAVKVAGDGTLSVTVPAAQAPETNVFPPMMAAAMSNGADRDLRFEGVVSIIRFRITRNDILSVIFSGNEGEKVAGTLTLSPETGTVKVSEGRTFIEMTSDQPFTPGTYAITVLPQTFRSGICFTLSNQAGEQAERMRSSAFTLEKGGLVDAADIDQTKSWGGSIRLTGKQQFLSFLTNASSYPSDFKVVLGGDMDLSGETIPQIDVFSAILDGGGHSLRGWEADAPLINVLKGSVRNLVIADDCTYSLDGENDAAWIAAFNEGTVSGVKTYGKMSTASGLTLTQSCATGAVAAVNSGLISSCENFGDITLSVSDTQNPTRYDTETKENGSLQYLGGIVGRMETGSRLNGCKNHGALTYQSNGAINSLSLLGGIAGGTPWAVSSEWFVSPVGTMSGCENDGAVTFSYDSFSSTGGNGYNTPFIGGVTGFIEGTLEECLNTGAVKAILPLAAWDNNGNSQFARGIYLGGVAGIVTQSATSCTNSAPITLKGTFAGGANFGWSSPCVGGVFGFSGNVSTTDNFKIAGCSNTARGSITARYHMRGGNGTSASLGGISGYNTASMSNCANQGAVTVYNAFKSLYGGGVAGCHRPFVSGTEFVSNTNSGTLTFDLGYSGSSVTKAPVGGQSQTIYLGGLIGWSTCDGGKIGTLRGGANSGAIKVRGGSATGYKDVGGILGLDNGYLRIDGGGTWTVNSGDLTLENMNASTLFAGGISGQHAGRNANSTAEAYEQYVRNTGNISVKATATCYVGGIRGAGTNNTGYGISKISHAENSGAITVEGVNCSVGGIEGWCATSTGNGTDEILDAVNGSAADATRGTVSVNATGWAYAGGIRGRINKSDVNNSVNYGAVTVVAAGQGIAGGIDGYHADAARVKGSDNYGPVTLTTGGDNSALGGLYGSQNGQCTTSHNHARLSLTSSGTTSYIGGVMGRNGATQATGGSTGDLSFTYTGDGTPVVYASPVCGYSACQFTCLGPVGGKLTLGGTDGGDIHAGAVCGHNTASGMYLLGEVSKPLAFSRTLDINGTPVTSSNYQSNDFLFGSSSVELNITKTNITLTD